MAGRKEPGDPGIVVYWQRTGIQYALACDRYDDRAANLRAIAKTIEAMRGIERWGVLNGEQAYKGVEALPPGEGDPTYAQVRAAVAARTVNEPPHAILGVNPNAPPEVVEAAYRALIKKAHPDAGGDAVAFWRLTDARNALLAGRT